MIRTQAGDELGNWVGRAKPGVVASFANAVGEDKAAATAGITPGSQATYADETRAAACGLEAALLSDSVSAKSRAIQG